jgi:adenylosuccinate lyase
MARIWSDMRMYREWLNVELAVIWAREKLGLVPEGTCAQIKKQARFWNYQIEAIEKVTRHDLLAFVQNVQESLDVDFKKIFHGQGMTSYDTEEPATALRMLASLRVIFDSLEKLKEALVAKALEYKYLLKIHRTHGQHAEPTTLGLELLWWYDALERWQQAAQPVFRQIQYSKISGAVGTYAGGLSPELEAEALGFLKLVPAKVSAQIILRDRHARVMNELAVLAGILENIALNFRIYGQSEIREIQEPFGKGQKGSSVMPHKKNTILTENLCGLARVVRANAGIALENIPTWSGRDISHSSAERIIFADSFHLADFMLGRLTKVIMGMVVNQDRIKENLHLTRDAIFSPDVKELFMEHGMDPERAYSLTQELAFRAINEGHPYKVLVLMELEKLMTTEEANIRLCELFKMERKVQHVDDVFARFGI